MKLFPVWGFQSLADCGADRSNFRSDCSSRWLSLETDQRHLYCFVIRQCQFGRWRRVDQVASGWAPLYYSIFDRREAHIHFHLLVKHAEVKDRTMPVINGVCVLMTVIFCEVMIDSSTGTNPTSASGTTGGSRWTKRQNKQRVCFGDRNGGQIEQKLPLLKKGYMLSAGCLPHVQ